MARRTTDVLRKLRDVMKNSKYVSEHLDAYIIPSGDAHQSEYIAPADARRAFISGFTGSRGTAVVTEKQAAMWTDGRYFVQAKKEMDENWILMKERIEGTPSIEDWLNEVLPENSKIGFDPSLVDYGTWKTLDKTFKFRQNSLFPVKTNLVDVVWENKPNPPSNPVEHLDIQYTGKSFQDKVLAVREKMNQEKATTLIITALDEVAWLFNLRGSDIDFNPVFFSYAIVTLDAVYLFIDSEKLTEKAKKSLSNLENMNLKILPYMNVLDTLGNILQTEQGRIWVNKKSSYKIVSSVPKTSRLLKTTPVELLKSIKNETEIAGARNAHIKDGAAICEFLHWLSQEISSGNITEISASDKLENIKKEQSDFVGLSFKTISASGPNGAIIHYTAAEETDRKLTPSEMYLCDNGTQYRDGTTDVTRTWHYGEPSEKEILSYTLVLKGHIALSMARFPNLCTGHRIDCIARQFLWNFGLDYLHGTGHGVGSYLNVHEGPSGISLLSNSDDPGLQAGMILSIEPGYYEDEKFGIRLENLAVITECHDTPFNFQGKKYLTFEPLTLVPFQTKLIDPSLLTSKEISWLDDYHALCREKVGKLLGEQRKKEVLHWLNEATRPLH